MRIKRHQLHHDGTNSSQFDGDGKSREGGSRTARRGKKVASEKAPNAVSMPLTILCLKDPRIQIHHVPTEKESDRKHASAAVPMGKLSTIFQ